MEQALNLTIEELLQLLGQEKKAKYLILIENEQKDKRIAELEQQLNELKSTKEEM